MTVRIKGGHASKSLKGSNIEAGMVEVAVVSTSERGMVNSSSSSAISACATGSPQSQCVAKLSVKASLPALLPASWPLKSFNWILGLNLVPCAEANQARKSAVV